MTINRYSVIISIILSFILISCSSSSSNDEPQPPKQTLLLRSQSVADNSTIDASTATITLSYNNIIAIATGKAITLNGNKVAAETKGMDLAINVSLERWKDYELIIPESAICLKDDPRVTSQAKTIVFNTKYGQDPNNTPTIAASPVNPKATKEAKDLYKFLSDNYGKKMLSGAMGGIGWENTYTDFLQSQVGIYPYVVGFDYGHLPYSAEGSWINYGDISPVKKVHDRGCIVQIQWHWNVPIEEGSSELAFYVDKRVKFKPANILVEGTWENKVAEADIEKLASYLKLLQDANIAVLWRPFHEAAGDYQWGAWFWWGSQGVEVTKQLYHYLYDKLTNVYVLNNLIWVWTVQTSNEGKPATIAQMQEAYPGDEYVDIVGTDIYPEQVLTDQSAQYRQVYNTVEGRKMVALTECGNLIDPDKAIDNDALWSYFMQWYDYKDGKFGFYNYTGPEQWKQVTSNAHVLSK